MYIYKSFKNLHRGLFDSMDNTHINQWFKEHTDNKKTIMKHIYTFTIKILIKYFIYVTVE